MSFDDLEADYSYYGGEDWAWYDPYLGSGAAGGSGGGSIDSLFNDLFGFGGYDYLGGEAATNIGYEEYPESQVDISISEPANTFLDEVLAPMDLWGTAGPPVEEYTLPATPADTFLDEILAPIPFTPKQEQAIVQTSAGYQASGESWLSKLGKGALDALTKIGISGGGGAGGGGGLFGGGGSGQGLLGGSGSSLLTLGLIGGGVYLLARKK